jgi:(p)ppGpp synthase/HD superfamily hydrolase
MAEGRPFRLADAVALAFAAHDGQVDKAGRPYIDHVLRVMLQVEGEDARMTAVLHDVLEDSEITVVDLYEQGCPVEVVSAVVALTRRPGEELEPYLKRVASDPLAVTVKRADLADNRDPDRLELLPDEEAQRLHRKYAESLELLDRLAPPRP